MRPSPPGTMVADLGASLMHGNNNLELIPSLVVKVCTPHEDTGLPPWRHYVTVRGETIEHDDFAAFVAAPPLRGLGSSIDMLRKVCRDEPRALDAIDAATQRPAHIHASDVAIVNVRPTGNASAAALRRLRKDRTDLHAEVLAGNLSAHAAMVQAGFRPKTATIRLDRPDAIARTLRRHLNADEIHELIQAISSA